MKFLLILLPLLVLASLAASGQALALGPGTTFLSLPETVPWPQGVYLLCVQQGKQQQGVKMMRE